MSDDLRARLLKLAIAYHKTPQPDGEGEYGCNGETCPGVQRLLTFAGKAAQEAASWQPIALAPKDGRSVAVHPLRVFASWDSRFSAWICDDDGCIVIPTHFYNVPMFQSEAEKREAAFALAIRGHEHEETDDQARRDRNTPLDERSAAPTDTKGFAQ